MPVTPAPGRAKIRKVVNSSLAMATARSCVKKKKTTKKKQLKSLLHSMPKDTRIEHKVCQGDRLRVALQQVFPVSPRIRPRWTG